MRRKAERATPAPAGGQLGLTPKVSKDAEWAVCLRIEQNGPRLTTPPDAWKLFKTKSAARRFLRSKRPPSNPWKPEAQVTGLSAEQVRARRMERNAQLRKKRARLKERAEWAEGIRAGELCPLAAPARLQVPRNRDRGWEGPWPIRRFSDYSGPKCNLSLREFLPVDRVPGVPKWSHEEEICATGRLESDYTCCLGEDWHFTEIEAAAWRRHERIRETPERLSRIVIEAIHDLEAELQKAHPNAPSAAVADFWCSYEVQRHMADFCARLTKEEKAWALAEDRADAEEQVELARVWTYRQLASFAHEAAEGDSAQVAEISPDPQSEAAPAKVQLAPLASAAIDPWKAAGRKPDLEKLRKIAPILREIADTAELRRQAEVVCEGYDQARVKPPDSWKNKIEVDIAGGERKARRRPWSWMLSANRKLVLGCLEHDWKMVRRWPLPPSDSQ